MSKEKTLKMSRRNILAAGGSTAIIAIAGAASSSLAQSVAPQTSPDLRTASDTLGANARQVMIDIFRKKDPAAVDRHFGESFILFFFNCSGDHRDLHSFPTRRSSD